MSGKPHDDGIFTDTGFPEKLLIRSKKNTRSIFPGGMVPSLREMVTAMAEYDFHTMDIENLRLHYNRTLRCWRKNYLEHLDEVKTMFDDRFIRMWDLYLAACAATFHNGIIDLHQILMTKGINNDLPMVRWY